MVRLTNAHAQRTIQTSVMSDHGKATHIHCHTTSYNLAAALPRACVHTINNDNRVQSGSRSTTQLSLLLSVRPERAHFSFPVCPGDVLFFLGSAASH